MKSQIILKLIAQLTVLSLLTFVSNVAFACDDAENDSDTAEAHIQAVKSEAAELLQNNTTHDDCDCCDGRCFAASCSCAHSTCSYVYITPVYNDHFTFKISENIVTQFSHYSFSNSPPLLRPPIS
jgi:hypothetical protein